MGMNVGGRGKGIQPSMNVTPLVDVVLVLLIIFMVVTPLLAKQMSVRVPEKQDEAAAPAASNDVPIVVMVKNDGSIELNRAPISEDKLVAELEKVGDKVVFFSAEEGVTYGTAVAVLDRAKQSGATVAVLTEQPK